MKRTLWVLVLFAMMGLGASSLCAGNVTIGLKGGLSVANLRGGDVYNNSALYGAGGGAFARYTFTKVISVQLEALLTMKGAAFEAEGIKAKERINYVEIPLLVRASMPNESKLKPSVFAGPAIGLLLSNKIKDGAEIDLKDASRSADIGIVGGAGLEYTIAKGCILLDARYELGLASTYKKSEDKEAKNGAILVMVGYGMHF